MTEQRKKAGTTLERRAARYLADFAGGIVPQTDEVVRFCLARDLMRRVRGDVVVSDAGRAWLRRWGRDDDAFRAQHQSRAATSVEQDGARVKVTVNRAESPLGWLRRRKDRQGHPLIGDAQFTAGERLRADYTFAGMSQRVTANWDAPAPGRRERRAPADAAALRDDVLAAKMRVSRALEAVGPELSGVLIDICCELKGLEEAEKTNGWPQRSGKIVLELALTRLARHYGLMQTPRPKAGKMLHWGAADYRPRI